MIGTNLAITTKNYAAGGAVAYDADAVTFFTAASITDTTQKSAVNQLVLDLKSANIWTKMKALYPVVGGVASSHAVNLKTPGTFNLSFQTGWTHTSTGMTPNGATYADTNFNPSINLTTESGHVSFYSRDIAQGVYDIGVASTSNISEVHIIARYTDDKFYSSYGNYSTVPTTTNTDGRGFYITNRNSTTNTVGYKNTSKVINTAQAGALPNLNIFISGLNRNGIPNPGSYGNKQCAFASIGDGLTDAEASLFYTAVQTFQTTLNRQIP